MFYDRPDCIKVTDGIYVFKKYIPQSVVDDINNKLKAAEDHIDYQEARIDWYRDKISPEVEGLVEVWEHLSDLIYPEYVIHPQKNLIITRPGDGGMFCHSDSPGKGCEMHLTQIDTWQTCCVIDYGLIGYFGEFTGGAVYYPNFNPDGTLKTPENSQDGCLEVFPEPGDVVIHGSVTPWDHGVREVDTGIRYAFSNFSLKAEDNPGTFYNYKTPEYYERLGNRTEKEIIIWGTPLMNNPQFYDENGKLKPVE